MVVTPPNNRPMTRESSSLASLVPPSAAPPGVGKVALITGAGSGIGRQVAIGLAGLGFRVVLVGRRMETLQETAGLCLASSNSATTPFANQPSSAPPLCLPLDLEVLSNAQVMVDRTIDHFGRLDVLVNNAGWSPAATIPQTTPAVIERVYMLNAMSPTLAITAAWPWFVKQGSGCVVNVSSMATVDPFDTLYAYAAAKASVNLLARSVANQGAGLGITGYAVAPGAVETDLLRSLVTADQLPPSHTLTPDAVADVIVACVLGNRLDENGKTILLPSPSL